MVVWGSPTTGVTETLGRVKEGGRTHFGGGDSSMVVVDGKAQIGGGHILGVGGEGPHTGGGGKRTLCLGRNC